MHPGDLAAPMLGYQDPWYKTRWQWSLGHGHWKGNWEEDKLSAFEGDSCHAERKVLSQGQSSCAPQQVECYGKKYPVHESDALEEIYTDSSNKQSPIDSDQVQCTQSTWQQFVQSMSHANSLAFMWIKKEQTVLHETTQLQQYENHLDPLLGCGDCLRLWLDLIKSVRKCPMPYRLCYWEQAPLCSKEKTHRTR